MGVPLDLPVSQIPFHFISAQDTHVKGAGRAYHPWDRFLKQTKQNIYIYIHIYICIYSDYKTENKSQWSELFNKQELAPGSKVQCQHTNIILLDICREPFKYRFFLTYNFF